MNAGNINSNYARAIKEFVYYIGDKGRDHRNEYIKLYEEIKNLDVPQFKTMKEIIFCAADNGCSSQGYIHFSKYSFHHFTSIF